MIHESIKEYFNSYWFAELTGFFDSYSLILESVLPGAELNNFYAEVAGFYINYNNLNYIPIGIESNTTFSIVVDNQTGAVGLFDDENEKYIPLMNSLASLIDSIYFR